ncbi:hypothetical protein SAMN05421827_13414 [Pedobacter terrae]|uniref:Uncharacterized protein n=1 Tax=Pedobacter terrae TaxID=405671 RepID=A0A1G8E642_9SPHI|nr:hypothetical protein [Pedobacter terrae]SDH65418.1 hypothetical protein SAMN05421827_13414 [Pedobacter terrae]
MQPQKWNAARAYLAPVEVLPCSNEVRGSEAYKRKTGGNLMFFSGSALQTKEKYLSAKFIMRLGCVSYGTLMMVGTFRNHYLSIFLESRLRLSSVISVLLLPIVPI